MTLVLTAQELTELTGRCRAKPQARQLAHMGIPFRTRSDGSLAVLRIHVVTIEPSKPEPTPRRAPRLRFDS